MLKKFDTKVQHIKYKVLREVARASFEDNLLQALPDLPKKIIPGKEATMRCCVYKERAIINERMKLAMGGNKDNKNIIEVIDIACDECPVGGYQISDACRGCIAHRCMEVCPRDAISFDHSQRAYINKDKCVECGKCASVCPYSAVANYKRPCEKSCQVGAISMGENDVAYIDEDKCISCGACVYQCPFGAIQDKSYILDVIDMMKNKEKENTKIYAIVAPSISSQFNYAKLGQVITGIKKLGFFHVVEAALGADMVSYAEAQELVEKGFLTSSCCPSFVDYVHKFFPDLEEHVSHNLSPMAAISKYIKETTPEAKTVFIGPCTSKKMEFQKEEVHSWVDCVITFEELQALFDSRDIDLTTLQEDVLDNASYYGRIFARSGGLAEAVKQSLSEQKLDEFAYNPVACDGIKECKTALFKKSKGVLKENFIEGMACVGGCIGGAGCLSHGPKQKKDVDKYGEEALEKSIVDAITVLK